MNHATRFSGKIGEDYALFMLAVPHHEEFQDSVAAILKNYCQNVHAGKPVVVVEVGCGTGYTTRRILQISSVRVVAVDNEEQMISQTRRNLSDNSEGEGSLEVLCADALEYLKTLPENSIDALVSAYAIHNFTPLYRKTFFEEVARVLREGAFFINGDKYARDDCASHKRDLDEQIARLQVFREPHIDRPDLTIEWTKHYLEDELTRITESEQRELLESCGFTEVKYVYRKGMDAIVIAQKN
ncbi:class I SAM-dependent methyltransferase [Patescibacteria group bacterium]|nr:class I SAM-dependent methyltransferase [Patescibacteria group bacterium]